MPVNTAALKTFAPAMRRQLLEAVGRKLDRLLHQASADTLTTAAGPIEELRQQEATNRQELLERVAYSWFNRLAALRYLDARLWHPFGARVLMAQTESETQPELLKLLRSGSLPAELQPHTDEARLQGLLDGRIPTAQAGADPQGEVYRELILAVCRSYHQLLPNLFEGLDDASELLLPDDLLSDGSIAGGFRSQISDDDCEDVEIIGWLYQFYISEKKEQVIGKVVKSEDIPAATQLFTPNWIVKYMVQNSLGAQWLATYPASDLKGQMEYYIEPAEQTDDVKAQLAAITPEALNPEELTLIDPACGSGHILVEAYELFKAIYLERGYQQREIPQLILEKNLFGLDIDERAAQLTSFALMMKGRGDDRRLFERGIQLNVMALVNSNGLDSEGLANVVNLSAYGLILDDITGLQRLFEHATTLGSLIKIPESMAEKLIALKELRNESRQDIIAEHTLNRVHALAQQAKLLAGSYDIVVANPPYMTGKYFTLPLRLFTASALKDGKADLFGCFVERALELCRPSGRVAMITMQNIMYLSSFSGLRKRMLTDCTINSLVHNGRGVWGSDFGSCSFAIRKQATHEYVGVYRKLFDKERSVATINELEERFHQNFDYLVRQSDFEKVPGSPLTYWTPESVKNLFASAIKLSEISPPRAGMTTGDDQRFLRLWHELSIRDIGFEEQSSKAFQESDMKWAPYNKGGAFQKWFGNNLAVVNWKNDGEEIKQWVISNPNDPNTSSWSRRIFNHEYFFEESVTWSLLSGTSFCVRYIPKGAVFNVNGPSLFQLKDAVWLMAGLLNSTTGTYLLRCINPTLAINVGDVAKLPIPEIPKSMNARISDLAKKIYSVYREDWESNEASWGFQGARLAIAERTSNKSLELEFREWVESSKRTINEVFSMEEELNQIFITIYGMQDERIPRSTVGSITLAINPDFRYPDDLIDADKQKRFRRDTIAELLSYATGCMMGRYSLDQPGLILANAGDTLDNYYTKVGKGSDGLTFQPDSDGIIPVLDGEWFEDDIVARSREFLVVTFPESSVADNLRFIEDSLGKDIRKYFCTDFYKDHLQTYKKRPIYWLVQSPKKGFACLIYLHRYTKDTLNLVLNNYFRPYLQKLEARLAQLGLDQLNDDLPTRERTASRKEAEKITKVLKECQAWEQDALLPLAQQRIELDLDDGVKVNYLKLQDVLAPIPGLAAKEE
ncbi:MAG: BREX-1 system adenine-specific DNA-methyltransferase PglX [Cyanobium sp. LacPavin_0920_WC12_MAG_62_9]|nr:BREX-1 system adenine-specific DNA-methyltransferase PglX [Cyanobium sp. LacPavin_0920_WC12_MAG_62_9]